MKPDALIIYVGTNDLIKGVNTIRKVRKGVEVIWKIQKISRLGLLVLSRELIRTSAMKLEKPILS